MPAASSGMGCSTASPGRGSLCPGCCSAAAARGGRGGDSWGHQNTQTPTTQHWPAKEGLHSREQGQKHSRKILKPKASSECTKPTAALAGASPVPPRLMSYPWAGPGELTSDKHFSSFKNQPRLASLFSSAQEIRHVLAENTCTQKSSATCWGCSCCPAPGG